MHGILFLHLGQHTLQGSVSGPSAYPKFLIFFLLKGIKYHLTIEDLADGVLIT